MVKLEKNYRAYGYNRVLSVGLPSFSGRYFVVLGERQTLLLAELNVQEDGSHAWSHYQSGSLIPESLITMWKLIQL